MRRIIRDVTLLGLAVAAVGVIVALLQWLVPDPLGLDGPDSQSRIPPKAKGDGASSPSSTSSSQGVSEPTSTTATAGTVTKRIPKIELTGNYGLDFETGKVVPRERSDVYLELPVIYIHMRVNDSDNTALSMLNSNERTYQACMSATRYDDVVTVGNDDELRVGDKFCVFDRKDNKVALFEYLNYDGTGTLVLIFRVTIWKGGYN